MAALLAALASGSGSSGSRGGDGGAGRAGSSSSSSNGSSRGSLSSSRGSLSSGGSSSGSSRGSRGGAGGGSSSGAGGGVGGAGATKDGGDGGAGNGVVGEGGVQVEEDTGVGLGVESGTEGSVGQVGAGAGDLEVDTHGVVLGTVRVLGAVEGDDLVTQDVVASLEGGGDGNVVGVVVGDQVVRGPDSWVRAGDETSGVDLDPLEGGLVNGGRVISGRDVGDDGAVVLR